MTMPNITDLISRGAAVKKLGIHPNGFDRRAKAAGLKRYRLIGDARVYYLRADIDKHFPQIVEVSS